MIESKIILITGAGSGFGRLTAIELARAGHIVYASMRDLKGHSKEKAEGLQTLAYSENLTLNPLELDVRLEKTCRAAADFILAQHGHIDVVINNAAMMMAGITEAFRPEQFMHAIDLNAISWVRVNRAFLPAMRRQGKGLLLYIGSGITHIPDPFTGPYAASKAAGDVLAQTMALENSRYGIESVIVMPGAYTSGTDHFKNAVGPADVAVVDQYDRLSELSQQLASKLDSVNVPGARTDANEVAEVIRDVIAMKHGTRPGRVEVDPQQRGALRIAELAQEQRAAFFRRMGIDDLLSTQYAN
jgi:NAD(P)-dependent dehydrogenase (short-subunit alcohol dehydrogenase family)